MGANLYQRYIKVMKDCGYIQKQGRNDFHKYNYAAAAQVLEKVNESCVENGIATIAIPEVLTVETPTNRSGAQENRVTVHMAVTLVNIDDPKEQMTLHGIGCGQDAGDKAVMKAQTAAMKYAWMMGLQISTGDDPEADTDVDKRMHGEQKKQSTQKTVQQSTQKVTSLRDDPALTAIDWTKVAELTEALNWTKREVANYCNQKLGHPMKDLKAEQVVELEELLQKELDARADQEVA